MISLIVLVITIIVMIILAAAVILSLNDVGIIGNANKAVNKTSKDHVNHMVQLICTEAYINGKVEQREQEINMFGCH